MTKASHMKAIACLVEICLEKTRDVQQSYGIARFHNSSTLVATTRG